MTPPNTGDAGLAASDGTSAVTYAGLAAVAGLVVFGAFYAPSVLKRRG